MSKDSGGPVARFVVHLFTYVAVCGFLVCVWALTLGSFDEVSEIARDPGRARRLDFWPIWVILGWGVAIVIHLGVVISRIPRLLADQRTQRRAAARRREAARAAARVGEEVMQRSAAALRSIGTRRPARPEPPARRWVSVMFTDIVDSTRLAETLGDEEWSEILGRYRGLVRAAFAARGGEEVGTQGDGFLARFPSPAEAVLCAVDIQREMEHVPEATDFDLQVRIGVHAGEAVEDQGDLVGRVVNLASRVTGAAEPGEILVTEPVADYLGGRLQLEDRGLRELRGVEQPRHLLAVRWDSDEPAADAQDRS
ncbi:MAG: adenylate/guanylate cyclase domain-containing protein [Acidimicrobiia bacterium]